MRMLFRLSKIQKKLRTTEFLETKSRRETIYATGCSKGIFIGHGFCKSKNGVVLLKEV